MCSTSWNATKYYSSNLNFKPTAHFRIWIWDQVFSVICSLYKCLVIHHGKSLQVSGKLCTFRISHELCSFKKLNLPYKRSFQMWVINKLCSPHPMFLLEPIQLVTLSYFYKTASGQFDPLHHFWSAAHTGVHHYDILVSFTLSEKCSFISFPTK